MKYTNVKNNKKKKKMHTKFWTIGFSCSTPSSFREEFNWSVTVGNLSLDIFSKYCPIEFIITKGTANVEGTRISQQPTKKVHTHKIYKCHEKSKMKSKIGTKHF